MARQARRRSSTGIYHIMMRGVNKQKIFFDKDDHYSFLSSLKKFKPVCGYEIYAYCLMPNHIHLLMKDGCEPVDQAIKRISNSFVYWYNLKYQRVGHLFQNRYKSEAVENDAYFLNVLRYIIQNPMKAGLETFPGSYPWSSYCAYSLGDDLVTDTDRASQMFGSKKALLDFLCQANTDRYIDITDSQSGVTNDEACRIAAKVTGCRSHEDFMSLEKALKNEFAKALREEGLSYNQIARFTGMPKTSVLRAARS